MLRGATRSLQSHVHEYGNIKVLKNAVIYGANGYGKTAFVSAISTAKGLIVAPHSPRMNIDKSYCRIKPENKEKVSYFEFIFSTNERFYSYGYEIILSERRICSEWLLELDDELQEKREYFTREFEKLCFKNGGYNKDDESRLNIYADDMKDKQDLLFLTEMRSKNIGDDSELIVFKNVFDWFNNRILINSLNAPNRDKLVNIAPILNGMDTDIKQITFNRLESDEYSIDSRKINRLSNVIKERAKKNPNLGIIESRDWVIYELDESESVSAFKICTKHNSTDSEFEMTEESTGTRNLTFFSSILADDEDDVTYIFDEFGASMHPLLTYQFIKQYQKYNENRSCQLIVATHEMYIMTLDLFRRDEIWFISKEDGASSLYSLEEFQERFDRNLSKAYMEGRYGALPVFTETKWGE